MIFNTTLSIIAALFSLALAVFVLLRDSNSFVHRIFAAGMAMFALEAGFIGLSFKATSGTELMYWQHYRLFATAVIPSIWLLFALTYARVNYKEIIAKWSWVILIAFAIPLILVIIYWKSFFIDEPVLDSPSVSLIRLGRSGYIFHLFYLVSVVPILMNLERTLRESTGNLRWQVKFMVLGLCSFFAVRIYTDSQTVLFSSFNPSLSVLNCGALIIANALILKSLLRSRLLNIDFYLSHSFLYNSIAVLIVGVYFLAVGVLAKLIHHLKGGTFIYLNAFLIFLALLGLSIVLLSDRLRHKIRRFIAVHMKRPQYDYHKEWMRFTEKTSTITDVKDLCMTVSRMISDVLEVLSVTVWLLDEPRSRLNSVGSTVFSETGAGHRISEEAEKKLLQAIRNQEMPVDLDNPEISWAPDLKQSMPDSLREARIRYCVPLSAGGNLLGVITLGEKVEYASFSFEEMDLLKTIADQTAGSLLNLKLSEDLRKAKEMEAFQTMSTFVVHDLKNLASTLSLTMQNLPIHFDNPDFRNDALQIIKQSVTKVNSMCSNLSMLSQKIELKRVDTDLNELVSASLNCLNGSNKISLIRNLQPLSRTMIDPDQVQKVLINLLLNAKEAVGDRGEIRLATEQKDGWAILSVSDNGCGMSKEFMERSLFHPFKTTKKQGMGIGLFQSKMIVEAHQGRIEVESEEGRGTTFRVYLPLKG